MTTRITDSFVTNNLVADVLKNRASVNKYSQEVSTGLKVRNPGETSQAATIGQFQEMIGRIDGYNKRITTSTSMLTFQDDILSQASEVISRGKEVAAQAANETNSFETRYQQAAEIFQLRDQLVSLANSTYQGRYIFGGADDGDPPFDAATYTTPTTGAASQRYIADSDAGKSIQRTAQVTDDLNLTVTTDGTTLFTDAIQALERLGRSLQGYHTLPAITGSPPVSSAPTGGGVAYTATEHSVQTTDISQALDLLEQARANDIMPERVSIGARMKRLETATSLLELNKSSAQKVLDDLQNADVVESASKLSFAQTAFEASLQVTLRALNLNIMNYL